MTEGPLAGFTIGVTAARRHEELAALLERRGARVVPAPAIRLTPLADDERLLAATRDCIARPPDYTVVTTGIGFRSWAEAAESWGLREELLSRLRGIVPRGPKALGAVRSADLHEEWMPASESCEEILAWLTDGRIRPGTRVAVQLYGEPIPSFTGALRQAGAEVVEIPVYRWKLAADITPLRRLLGQAISGTVDAIAFTSAPAVSAMLTVAAEDGIEQELLEAFRADVTAACVGPTTAGPLRALGVPTLEPERARIGALARVIVESLPDRRARRLRAAGRALELRGHAVVIDGRLHPLAPAQMAVLRLLARRPGHVVSRSELSRALPGRTASPRAARTPSDEHAVEMAVTRLRRGLGPGIVETVVKRGYRLNCEPAR
jgi:uroporphyrinogen-III synthase